MEINLIKFGAPWCGQCKQQDLEIKRSETLNSIPLVIYDVDSTDEDVIEEYQIRSIPVTIVRDGDTIVKKFTGLVKASELEKTINEYVKSK